jgi:hypothetical protein
MNALKDKTDVASGGTSGVDKRQQRYPPAAGKRPETLASGGPKKGSGSDSTNPAPSTQNN